jgi:hypothetical protein
MSFPAVLDNSLHEQVKQVLRSNRASLQIQVKKQLEIHIRAENRTRIRLKVFRNVSHEEIHNTAWSVYFGAFVRLSSEKPDHLHVEYRGNTPTREQMECHILNFKYTLNNRGTSAKSAQYL